MCNFYSNEMFEPNIGNLNIFRVNLVNFFLTSIKRIFNDKIIPKYITNCKNKIFMMKVRSIGY